MSDGNGSKGLIYGIEDKPPLFECLGLGFQHYLTMFGSTVAIPLLLAPAFGMQDDPAAIGWLISTMFFVSGITTLLQTTLGNRLPLVQGVPSPSWPRPSRSAAWPRWRTRAGR